MWPLEGAKFLRKGPLAHTVPLREAFRIIGFFSRDSQSGDGMQTVWLLTYLAEVDNI